MRKITTIIVHCTATPEGVPVSVDKIRSWHIKERGFSDIGYHFIIGIDGTIHSGRALEAVGAHCIGHNTNSIGIAYVGGLSATTNLPKDTRTPSQKRALIELCTQLCERFSIARHDIYGHNRFSSKACPCFDVQEIIDAIPLHF